MRGLAYVMFLNASLILKQWLTPRGKDGTTLLNETIPPVRSPDSKAHPCSLSGLLFPSTSAEKISENSPRMWPNVKTNLPWLSEMANDRWTVSWMSMERCIVIPRKSGCILEMGAGNENVPKIANQNLVKGSTGNEYRGKVPAAARAMSFPQIMVSTIDTT
jgi:hypothetical protein